jgi:hypothetical protein
MKNPNFLRKIATITLSLVLLLSVLACGIGSAVDNVTTQYDTGIKVLQDSMKAGANFRLTVDTETGKTQSCQTMSNNYLQAGVATNENIRAKMRDAYNNLAGMDQKYAAAQKGSTVDLAQLQQQGALPGNLYSGFQLYVNAIQEAQVLNPDPSVSIQCMSITTGAYDHINASGRDWNDSVDAFNTWRRSIKQGSRVIADVANYFGVENLPDYLPYYGGNTNSTGSGGIPTQSAPTLSIPTP